MSPSVHELSHFVPAYVADEDLKMN